MVKQTKEQNTRRKSNKTYTKLKKQSHIPSSSHQKDGYHKICSNSTEDFSKSMISCPNLQNNDILNTQDSNPKSSISKITWSQRVKSINHLMWLVKKHPALSFHFVTFKSAQYLDIYIQQVQELVPNSLKTVIFACFMLACEYLKLEPPNVYQTIEKIYQFQFSYNQVMQIKCEIQKIVKDQIRTTMYDTFIEHLSHVQSQNPIISKQFLRKSHNLLRLCLLISNNDPLIPLSCLYLTNQTSSSQNDKKSKIRNILANNYLKQQLQPTIKFISTVESQFKQQKYIYLMVNQLKQVNLFV